MGKRFRKSFTFDTAEYNGIVTLNPVHNIQIPKRNSGKSRRSLTEEERAELLKVAEYHPMGLYVKIMLYCGLRTMEVAALDGWHIDRMNRLVHVRQNVGADGAIKGPKTDSGIRDVPIPEPLLNALSDVKLEPYQPVFTNAKGKRVDRNWIQTRWTTFKQCMLSDGCTSAYDLVPYDLRHTYCTDLQTAGVPINIARELMGHSSIKMTATIYTHHSDAAVESAREKINNFDRANRVPDARQ